MTRALVLSGGGSVGIAWQTGLVVGLARAGVRLADADLVVGTSAGSAVGAQLALGRDLEAQVARYAAVPPEAAAEKAAKGAAPGGGMARLMALMAENAEAEDPEAVRRKLGALALESTTPEESFVGAFSYLAGEEFPTGYCCTAVDAHTGAFQVWDAKTGAPLDRAVASSCSVPGIFPPITVNGRRYIDGGMRSGTNTDLAAGHDTVLVVSLMGGARLSAGAAPDPRMARYLARAQAEEAAVRDAGGVLETVGPDAEAAAVLGANLMDGSLGPAAAAAGVAQGAREAERLAAFWG